MKRFFIFLITVTIALFAFPFTGCVKDEAIGRSFYDIKAVYDDTAHTLKCSMNVSYVNNSDAILDELCFHLYPNAYRKDAQFKAVEESVREVAYPHGESEGRIDVESVKRNGKDNEWSIEGMDDDILVVALTKEIEPTERVALDIDFTVYIPEVRHRLGWVGDTVNLGNWYPIACVKTQSGFDTSPYYSNGDPFYSDCSDYKLTLTAPSAYTVAMPGKSERRENGVNVTYVSVLENARDYAFVIGKFDTLSTKVNGVDINYYYLKDSDAENTLACAKDAIAFFSDKFGAYPYSTYNVVETQFVYGGMEYPSLVYISDTLNKSMCKEAVIHETAHQWWYGVVGNDQINHAWMDEGLAEYSTTLFYEFNPSYNVTYRQRMADAMSAYIVYCDVTSYDGIMERNIGEFSAFDYTYVTYLKGALMFDAVRKTVGDEAFFRSLKNYKKEYSFKIASVQGLINTFENTTGRQLKNVFDSFLYGEAKIYR
ncbi:MAG: M1 family metallopeptidase [Clostridia bacterium]|nr:M1 family metallopeptidase [Clostridia bacterium]